MKMSYMTRRSDWRKKLKNGRSRSRGRRRPQLDKQRSMQSKRETTDDINDPVVATTEVIITAAVRRIIEIDSVRMLAPLITDVETEKGKQVRLMSTTMSEGIEMVTICLRALKSQRQASAIGTSSKIEGEYKFPVRVRAWVKNY